MAGYYAYLTGVDGSCLKAHAVVCEDDEEAKRFANEWSDGHAIELSQEARKIALFEPECQAAASRA